MWKFDYCPKCRGIWLDRGGLDKIIERAAATKGPWQADTAYDPRGSSRRHRRKSFLEELCDFD